MRFRIFPGRQEAQVQLRHPNYSGLQMDQVTRLYTPAWFVESLTIRQGDRPLFTLAGGQSGHPLSPHYADLLLEWAAGTYRSFDQPARDTLTLRPAGKS